MFIINAITGLFKSHPQTDQANEAKSNTSENQTIAEAWVAINPSKKIEEVKEIKEIKEDAPILVSASHTDLAKPLLEKPVTQRSKSLGANEKPHSSLNPYGLHAAKKQTRWEVARVAFGEQAIELERLNKKNHNKMRRANVKSLKK